MLDMFGLVLPRLAVRHAACSCTDSRAFALHVTLSVGLALWTHIGKHSEGSLNDLSWVLANLFHHSLSSPIPHSCVSSRRRSCVRVVPNKAFVTRSSLFSFLTFFRRVLFLCKK